DSLPFLIPSAQEGAAQVCVARSQTLEAQSPPCRQPLPPLHGAQLPPQSTPVSLPSWIPSLQDAGMHVCVGLHPWPPRQSVEVRQATQLPSPSQSVPPEDDVHAVPGSAGI